MNLQVMNIANHFNNTNKRDKKNPLSIFFILLEREVNFVIVTLSLHFNFRQPLLLQLAF